MLYMINVLPKHEPWWVDMNIKKLSLIFCLMFVASVAFAAECNEITQDTNNYRIPVPVADENGRNGIVNDFTPTVTNQLYKVELDASKDCKYIWDIFDSDGNELVWRPASGDLFGLGSLAVTLTAGKTYSMRVWTINEGCSFGGTSSGDLYYKLYFSSSGTACSDSCVNLDHDADDQYAEYFIASTCTDSLGTKTDYVETSGTPHEYVCDVNNRCISNTYPGDDYHCPYGVNDDFTACAKAPENSCSVDAAGVCTDSEGNVKNPTCDGKFHIIGYECYQSKTCVENKVECQSGYECDGDVTPAVCVESDTGDIETKCTVTKTYSATQATDGICTYLWDETIEGISSKGDADCKADAGFNSKEDLYVTFSQTYSGQESVTINRIDKSGLNELDGDELVSIDVDYDFVYDMRENGYTNGVITRIVSSGNRQDKERFNFCTLESSCGSNEDVQYVRNKAAYTYDGGDINVYGDLSKLSLVPKYNGDDYWGKRNRPTTFKEVRVTYNYCAKEGGSDDQQFLMNDILPWKSLSEGDYDAAVEVSSSSGDGYDVEVRVNQPDNGICSYTLSKNNNAITENKPNRYGRITSVKDVDVDLPQPPTGKQVKSVDIKYDYLPGTTKGSVSTMLDGVETDNNAFCSDRLGTVRDESCHGRNFYSSVIDENGYNSNTRIACSYSCGDDNKCRLASNSKYKSIGSTPVDCTDDCTPATTAPTCDGDTILNQCVMQKDGCYNSVPTTCVNGCESGRCNLCAEAVNTRDGYQTQEIHADVSDLSSITFEGEGSYYLRNMFVTLNYCDDTTKGYTCDGDGDCYVMSSEDSFGFIVKGVLADESVTVGEYLDSAIRVSESRQRVPDSLGRRRYTNIYDVYVDTSGTGSFGIGLPSANNRFLIGIGLAMVLAIAAGSWHFGKKPRTKRSRRKRRR